MKDFETQKDIASLVPGLDLGMSVDLAHKKILDRLSHLTIENDRLRTGIRTCETQIRELMAENAKLKGKK